MQAVRQRAAMHKSCLPLGQAVLRRRAREGVFAQMARRREHKLYLVRAHCFRDVGIALPAQVRFVRVP